MAFSETTCVYKPVGADGLYVSLGEGKVVFRVNVSHWLEYLKYWECLICIARHFRCSLDRFLLGGRKLNLQSHQNYVTFCKERFVWPNTIGQDRGVGRRFVYVLRGWGGDLIRSEAW